MVSELKAVILAAGVGSRLRPLTDDIPKAMVDIGGQTLLDRLARQCEIIGAAEIIVVTGYRAEAVDAWAATAPVSTPIVPVFNPDYATMNNGQSLFVVRDYVDGDAMIKFDGDLILSTSILQRLAAFHEADSALVLDSTRALVEEDMRVRTEPSGRVTAIGKWIPLHESAGVSIGVERFSPKAAYRVFEALERMVHHQGRTDCWYEDAYHDLLQEGMVMRYVDTEGEPWTEIDTPEDLERARSLGL